VIIMKRPNFSEEKKLWPARPGEKGYRYVAGLDEAGRGPLAGPVVAAAVVNLSRLAGSRIGGKIFQKINDSKKMTAKDREEVFEALTKNPNIKFGVGIVSEKIIDKINILEASKLAMGLAVKNLEKKFKVKVDFLLIDGNFKIYCATPQRAIIKGDQKVMSIAMASIIAKVTRDRIMQKLHKKYPQYGFEKHKGYGTALHFKMLKKHGACPIHRKTFYPMRVIHT
jgi:ribonuclease HII